MNSNARSWIVLVLLSNWIGNAVAEESNSKRFVYKTTPQAKLELIVDSPPDWKGSDRRPAVVFFFGGGWQNGTVLQFEPQARYFASRGLVTVRADYRVKSRHGVSPRECVEDAKSAIRWIRSHSKELGVDPDRIVAAGGSAGGHIAACTSLTPGLDSDHEDMATSSRPNALILYNPVLRFSGEKRLMPRINNDEKLGELISPTRHLSLDTPPILLLYGTADPLIEQGKEFVERANTLRLKVELFSAENQKHGFFNRSPWLESTTRRVDAFLRSIGYLDGEPTLKENDPMTKKRSNST